MEQQLYLARYGLPETPLVEFKGPFDMALSKTGEVAALELASWLKTQGVKLERVFCSPFRRALQTASLVAGRLGIEICIEEGLTEWQTPSLIGQEEPYRPPELNKLREEFPVINEKYTSRIRPVPFETEKEMIDRTGETVKALADAAFPGSLLIISHAPCLLGASLSLSDSSEHVKPWPLGGVTQFSRNTPEGWALVKYVSTSHLSGPWKLGKQAWTLPCLQ